MSAKLHHQTPKHEKVRFRRTEITDLSAMPSAAGQPQQWRGERRRRRTRVLIAAVVSLALLVFAAGGGLAVMIRSDWGAETLRQQAEQVVRTVAAGRAEAGIGPSRIMFGKNGIGLEFTAIELKSTGSSAPIASAGSVAFGVKLLPLLTGRLQLGSATISDASISLADFQGGAQRDWTATLRDEHGLIDPDLIAAAAFRPLYATFDAVAAGVPERIVLKDIDIVLPEDGQARRLRIEDATLTRNAEGELEIAARLLAEGREVTIAGKAVRDAGTRLISAVDLRIEGDAPPEGVAPTEPAAAGRLGGFMLTVTGADRPDGAGPMLKLSGTVEQSVLDLGARGAYSGRLQVDATLEEGSDKLELNRLLVETGRTRFDLNGAIGPRPAASAGENQPAYRFELVSAKALLAPEASPEPPLDVAAQLSGIFDPATGVITTDSMEVRSDAGKVIGSARIDLVKGKAPGIAMAISLRDMPVTQVKQLWPWFSAGKARQWVFEHLFGGQVVEADVEFKVAPGRLGNGVPLSPEEIVGRFVVAGTRFDTISSMPPVRNADGTVEVKGHDVDVTLTSGTMYLPSGRRVTGTDGKLTIRNPSVQPVIARLDIDIDGDANAVAEFASMPPINALRRTGFTADDLTGTVKGHVASDIPLQKGVDPATLDWKADLVFSNLGIAKPFGDQTLSAAGGTLKVTPTEVAVAAKGLLNGVKATITMTEPLRDGGPERRRDIELLLDDAARKKIAPGLDQIMSGTARVEVEERDGVRHVAADLTDAKVDLPWAGWSKGAGVAASAQFSYTPGEKSATLRDFEFIGNSFSAAGELTLSGGSLASARLNRVTLNRGDDARVTVERTGSGYKVDVSGKSLDARALVKTYLSTSGSGSQRSGSPAKVSLRAALDSVSGFNGETLSGVTLQSDSRGFELAASSVAGKPVAVNGTTQGARSSLNVQTGDGGALLRFLDLYDKMRGGSIKLVMAGEPKGAMTGQVDARDFVIVNEPRLASVVSTAPAGSGRSLNDAAHSEIDTSRVQFERGYAQVDRGKDYLRIADGVLRGPVIGTTFQGTLYDGDGRIDMTGTFMPAYGVNRIFGEIPILGGLLGNGRDRGLIGVTFKLDGAAKSPRVHVNPLSVVAPGIFRSIFEFQ